MKTAYESIKRSLQVKARNGILLSAVIAFALCGIAPAALAQASVSGWVKGADGRAASGAEVRIERQDRKGRMVATHADGSGHFVADNLAAGSYAVGVGDKNAASIKTVRLAAGHPAKLAFDLRTDAIKSVSAGTNKIKHYVWVPAQTGTRIGGGYEEVGDRATADTSLAGPAHVLESLQVGNVRGANK